MKMNIRFPGGVAVDAEFGPHLLRTDQKAEHGGAGSAPPPFDLFLASIGTCAGFYALRFCQQRGIDTAGLSMTLEAVRDEGAKRLGSIRIVVDPPAGFPEKYHRPLLRSIDQCSVKQHILAPPEFEVRIGPAAGAADS